MAKKKLFSTKEVAALLKCHRDTVTRRSVRHNIGEVLSIGRVFMEDDIEELAKYIQDGPGNPNFINGTTPRGKRGPDKQKRKQRNKENDES